MGTEITTAVLLAAGRGKRLGDLTAKTPKPLLDIAGAPLISHIVDALVGGGLTNFIVVTGYLSEQIEGWAKIYERENPGIRVATVRQTELNGTGGAMLAAKAHLTGHQRFVFGWGDILMDRANYPRFIHHARNDEYDLMLAVNRVKDPFRGAAVYVSAHMMVERLDEKPAPGTAKTEWNNAGLFATGQIIFDYLARLEPSARGELEIPGAIAQMIADGRVVRAVDMRGFWSDVGTPEDLEAARAWFKPKKEAPMNLPDGWDAEELARAARLAIQVRAGLGADAQIFAARAPGRVNLIGEHTDYSGLPVLPVAIDRSTIVVAAANTTGEIEVANADSAWPSRRFAIERQIPSYEAGDWANYVKAAIQGVIDRFPARNLRGVSMGVDGRVPPAAGLSSSSALTVSTATSFMAVNGLELDSLETATMVARSERYVGTRGGGMDQAVSILGRRDHALFIEFDPLRVRAIKMPADAALVVADSRQIADKSGMVRAVYNRRVVECSLAARILGRALKLDGVTILGDVIRPLPKWNATDLVEKLAATSPARLDADLRQAANILGVSQSALDAELLGHGSNRIALDPNRPLEILKRARHVLSETQRVIRAAGALEAGRLDEMGTLMNSSHKSLAEDFECSTSRLDAMVECARRGGALGARLTGAGFGGAIVALCDVSSADAVIESIDRGYYAKQHPGEAPESWRSVLHAGAGASVIDLRTA